jgi:pimeloyl-ACP methyl ester carboxylesterase
MRLSRRRWIIVLAAAIVLINVVALAVGIYIQQTATRPPYSDPRQSYAQIFGISNEELARSFNSERFARLNKERVQLTSRHGARFSGLLIHAPAPARGTVAIGGYTNNVMPIGDVFLDRRFNVFTYPLFLEGRITFGFHEKFILESVVRFVRERDPLNTIGVYGNSTSAFAALQYAGMNEGSQDVSFYVIDCAFSDLVDLSRWHWKRLGLPFLFFPYASLVSYLRDGYFFGDVSPRRSIAAVRTPMLFIHGRADDVIPYEMSEELHRVKPGAKLLFIHDGGHCLIDRKGEGAIVKRRATFERNVDELLALAATGGV